MTGLLLEQALTPAVLIGDEGRGLATIGSRITVHLEPDRLDWVGCGDRATDSHGDLYFFWSAAGVRLLVIPPPGGGSWCWGDRAGVEKRRRLCGRRGLRPEVICKLRQAATVPES